MPDDTTGQHETILIADDDPISLEFAKAVVKELGYGVIEAMDGRQAVTLFESHLPDLVLLDVSMPEMDGIEACKAIRQLPCGQIVPILMVTGTDDFDSINNSFSAGATDFIRKPLHGLLFGYRLRHILRANRAFDSLSLLEKELARLQEIASLGKWEWTLESGQVRWPQETCRMLDLSQELCPKSLEEYLTIVHPQDRQRVTEVFTKASLSKEPFSVEHRIHRNGDELVLMLTAMISRDLMSRQTKASITVQDITQKKKTEQQIKFLAYYDRLTSLPNRFLFQDRLDKAVKLARRHKQHLAVLFLDLNNFRLINDSFGRTAGDKILQTVAERLRHTLRDNDTPARMGGGDEAAAHFGADEFGILVEELNNLPGAAAVLRRLIATLSERIMVDDQEVYVDSRIGVSIFPEDGEDPETLLQNAGAALSSAKELGKNAYRFYSPGLNEKAFARHAQEVSLRKAIERQEFELYYQPQVDVLTGMVVGVEALIRWQNPEMGLISPLEFIPLAEETGLILPIGEWVIRQACQQCRQWQEKSRTRVKMAVNLSATQFKDPGLADTISDMVSASGIDRNLLEFEVTESILMDDVEACITTLDRLRDLACHVALDDFGTGYSSLNYLKRFPINTLKIDKSFVDQLDTDQESAAIVKAIILLAQSLGLKVVAEGVECWEHYHFLKEMGCNKIQGYLISRPIPAAEVVQYFGTWNIEDL